ncbi:iron-hydroxamate ABC transporter substrate-binding protein [Paenibacillus glycanilyticus]|uniref:iron-hydroxamate ABC transporter substrate-binding protein n=1 Tax=Paenibacillus glycanilyticus TaxID=126569 RepID=UPI002041D172|nr:iron-hydroxamate ABC transporter substrate-binding protein [Paenibacillus glycanilyticus]MCM3629590.1 iron-hydroxamate ABC transporter substrate-binding protein [Paenibacillus glycanilyticus]
MFGKSKKRIVVLMSVMVLSLVLAACGGNKENNEGMNNSAATESASPSPEATETAAAPTEQKLTDGLGNEVTVPANPQKIIASYLEDYLVALGVKPVAQWSVPNGIQDYLQTELKDIPTIAYDLPFEAVTSFAPDLLILGSNSTVEGGKYEQYSKIAPTFVLGDEVNSDWRKALLKIGEVLQKKDQAQKVLDDYEAKAAEAKTKLQAAIPDQSVAALWLVANKFYVVSDKLSSGAVLYNDLGLKVPNVVKEISAAGMVSWNEISLEKLADLDADHLILINSDKATGSEALKDPIWQSIPAVKNGHVHEYEATTSWLYYGPVASSQMIDNVLKDFVK